MSQERNERRQRRYKKKQKRDRLFKAVIVLAVCVVLGGAGIFAVFQNMPSEDVQQVSAEPAATETTITVGSAGDIILHSPFYKASTYKKDGDYDFSPCFSYIKDTYNSFDFMAVNLETTLPGKNVGYSGYPLFKSPDSIADSLSESGVDLMLLANNHIFDSGKSGFLRTSQVLADKGYLYTGARHSDEEKRYLVKDINGIKVGFVNYTYETPSAGPGKAVNGNPVDESVASYLNSFDPNNLEAFYEDITGLLAAMRLEGAEFIISYPHWGNEYQLEACSYQKEMAQRLCDLGVDAIIGGHPHVVQPVDVLKSQKGGHKMLCVYSMGNQLSNQRREMMNLKTGNTEDGLIVNLEISRNSKGKVALTGTEFIPTWVYKESAGPLYYIIPVDDPGSVQEKTGKNINSQAEASYARTHKIIDEGVKKAEAEF